MLCTTTRAKKVVICLVLGSMAAQITAYVPTHLAVADPFDVYRIHEGMLCIVIPLSVLVINLIVVREMRRASRNASANLGRQQRQQSASTAVPTVMLVTTSLVYVLLTGISFVLREITYRWIWSATLFYCSEIAFILSLLIFAYNFYLYLITGKQFRSELRKLFC